MTDEGFMRLAIEESGKSSIDLEDGSDNKFTVGCVIVKGGEVVGTGYTGEEPFRTHAEETAIRKAGDVAGAVLYSTMEPCSIRLFTGEKPCVEWIIGAGITRVVYGAKEPGTYVNCRGHELLEKAGVEVVQLKGMEEECLEACGAGE
ncbi:MAG: dCMP deaminase [Candidatus Diapherotrites archaeon]|nr:dCMP deaminase [Candidatus Diapherotrites archaeon]